MKVWGSWSPSLRGFTVGGVTLYQNRSVSLDGVVREYHAGVILGRLEFVASWATTRG